MKTIVLNSQKGGSGKATLCRVLSVEAAHPEKNEGMVPVYLIDTDPQGTLNQWHDVRQAEDPRRVEPDINQISETLAKLKPDGRRICIYRYHHKPVIDWITSSASPT